MSQSSALYDKHPYFPQSDRHNFTRFLIEFGDHNTDLHLLESLSTVQSIVLVCDVPQSQELITEIFNVLFKMVTSVWLNDPFSYEDRELLI
jgi:hypothetical protein